MKHLNKKSGYSIIISLLIIGLLLILSTGILNMIMVEMKDNKGLGDNIKAYAGAESAQELALLKIKDRGYAYYDKIDHTLNNKSIFLSSNPLDLSQINKSKDVFISYDIGSKVSEYKGTLKPLGYNIIPLFYINDIGEHKINALELLKIYGIDANLVWNIIGKNTGLSGNGFIQSGVKKILNGSNELVFSEETINNFLNHSDTNYLVLFNAGNNDDIIYTLKASNSGEYFSKPQSSIISSGEVGEYKQNLETIIDNTKFLNILKYSIYSN